MTRRIASGVVRGQGRAALQAVWRAVKGVPHCKRCGARSRACRIASGVARGQGRAALQFSVNLVDVTRLALGLALVV